MPTFIATKGDDLLVQYLDRSYGKGPVSAFKVSGDDGSVTLPNGSVISPTTSAVMTGSMYSVVQAGKSAAGSLTLTGTLVGDKVIAVANLTAPADLQAGFETVITVAGKIQQSSATDLSTTQILFVLQHP
jgi:hypothetical protein